MDALKDYKATERSQAKTRYTKRLCYAVARTIVAMEQGYVTAAFFRHRMYERYRQWEEQEQLGRMLDEGGFFSNQPSAY